MCIIECAFILENIILLMYYSFKIVLRWYIFSISTYLWRKSSIKGLVNNNFVAPCLIANKVIQIILLNQEQWNIQIVVFPEIAMLCKNGHRYCLSRYLVLINYVCYLREIMQWIWWQEFRLSVISYYESRNVVLFDFIPRNDNLSIFI